MSWRTGGRSLESQERDRRERLDWMRRWGARAYRAGWPLARCPGRLKGERLKGEETAAWREGWEAERNRAAGEAAMEDGS